VIYLSGHYAVSAAHVGAPHRRDRVWIIAYPECEGRQGREPVWRILKREAAAFSDDCDPFSGAWRALDGDFGDLRKRDGVSVAVERRRLHALGNAVVPAIPEMIGRAILAAGQRVSVK
jgi:DNA (cytosine-5)-methyltransferase 1